MSSAQRGTSVLAALVFVAIFVLFISGYRIASRGADGQTASVASAFDRVSTLQCRAGEVHVVDMSSGSGDIRSYRCSGSDAVECRQSDPTSCVVQYCPPNTYVIDPGTCFVATACDAGDATCAQSAAQNALQPVQAPNVIAARLLADKGETNARIPGVDGPAALSASLSSSGRDAVVHAMEETADAVSSNNMEAGSLRDVAAAVRATTPSGRMQSGPTAQISCQPKIAQSGMKVAIAFGCANSTSNEGSGFSTGGRAWGATEELVPASMQRGILTYGISCSDGVRTAVASCNVSIARPFVILAAGQSEGGSATIAWVSKGMSTCTFSVPGTAQQELINPPESGALALPLRSGDSVTLACTTVSGEAKEATATVR